MTDNLKLVFSYTIAALIIVGGGYMLLITRLDPPESDVAGLRLLLSGFMGAAVTWVFSSESATRAARASENAYRNAQPTVTTSSGPPATTTVTPTEPER